MYLVYVLLVSGMYAAAFSVGSRTLRRWLGKSRRPGVRPDIPQHWHALLASHVPLARTLTGIQRVRLLEKTQDLVETRHWEGCGGLTLSEEIKVSIAAQACLLILEREGDPYPELESILVYPDTFRPRHFSWTPSSDPNELDPALGESWKHGVVILAWDSVQAGAMNPFDGQNVVLHEFAHQLDSAGGDLDGIPLLGGKSAYAAWTAVLEAEFSRLQEDDDQARPSVLDHYGATNRAEFFAVATEAFFEKSRLLRDKHPELYARLRGYYRQDPAEAESGRNDAP
ncbi:MAG: M90 family metallopeptidase [Gemmatimonadota bacterium]